MSGSIRWLRLVGMVEGVSFLLLLGVAMPLKYAAGMPEAVSVVGMAHGLLFIALWLVAAWAWARGLSGKLAFLAMIAAIVPAGPFLIDRKLKNAVPTPSIAEPRDP
ncbi:MAG: DUF3817 domain-containing protein [Planctomycetota bacterium]